MTVLVVNCGSSSLKWALLDPHTGIRVTTGHVERIGTDVADHTSALAGIERDVADALAEPGTPPLRAVGHRVVHGGDVFTGPAVIDDSVVAEIDRLAVLAPLHNPANALGIRTARSAFPDVPHVAVFDTAFHSTMAPAVSAYAVPTRWRDEYGVRRYGFHGTSHAHVSRVAAHWLSDHRGIDPRSSRIVVLHLGNGASACAVAGGRSIDTSMGLTPLAGLVMGTRSGDIDPAVVAHLERVAGLGADQVETALNRDSGLLALAGDADVRSVSARAAAGDLAAESALDVYCHRIRGYLGAYAVGLGGLDAVVFTAGVGEHSVDVRARVLAGLGWLGLHLDTGRNASDSTAVRAISTHDSRVTALVVPTDEEAEIAIQVIGAIDS